MAFSPVPAKIAAQPVAVHSSSAMAPIASASSRSDSGSQLTPPSSECQTPPAAVPSHTSFALAGLTAIAVARPVAPPAKKPLIGAGPMGNQLVPWISANAGMAAITVKTRHIEDAMPLISQPALGRFDPLGGGTFDLRREGVSVELSQCRTRSSARARYSSCADRL